MDQVEYTITKPTKYFVTFQRQCQDDPEDGMAAGWYAWVATRPDGESDFVYGPYKSEKEARKLIAERLAGKAPKRETSPCARCFEPKPHLRTNGERRFYCDKCIDDRSW